jgi:bifunctional enzyme CysN/CysC
VASLLGIPHIVVAVNKMDLVNYDERVFERIVHEYRAFAEKLEVQDLTFIPMSALEGDNVVHKSTRMPWYDGATLLHHLENVNVGSSRNVIDFRYPVQYVIRPHQDYRGFAGRVASGSVAKGDEVVVLPSGVKSRVRSVETASGALAEGSVGESVVVTLEDEVDVSRGDMIIRENNAPNVGARFEATLCWLSEGALDPATRYVMMHTTRQVQAMVSRIFYRVDVDTMHREDVETLGLNDIGRVELTLSQPVFYDAYQQNRATGSFILVDPFTNVTVAAGMIREVRTAAEVLADTVTAVDVPVSPGAVWESWNIPVEEREARAGHRAAVLWLTGLSGSGKTTIAREVERRLFRAGYRTLLLDGDQMRHGLCGDLGFSPADRAENIRRVGEVARIGVEHGNIVLCTLVSPTRAARAAVRMKFAGGRFFEVYVRCDLEACERRDPKGLYAKARAGEIPEFTGVSAAYEPPLEAEVVIDTSSADVDAGVEQVLELLRRNRIIPA